MVRSALAIGALVLFMMMGPVAAQDLESVVGEWASPDQAGLALHLNADGSGTAYQSADQSFPVEWTFDQQSLPMRLHLSINGEQAVALVQFDGPDRLLITEPSAEPPDSFADARLMTFDRVQ